MRVIINKIAILYQTIMVEVLKYHYVFYIWLTTPIGFTFTVTLFPLVQTI